MSMAWNLIVSHHHSIFNVEITKRMRWQMKTHNREKFKVEQKMSTITTIGPGHDTLHLFMRDRNL